MSRQVYTIVATWDDEAQVWVAESDDVPGLVSEAATSDALLKKLRVLVPELLELNGRLKGDDRVPVDFQALFRDRAELAG